jgi:uncharacterized membrane-anchored protein
MFTMIYLLFALPFVSAGLYLIGVVRVWRRSYIEGFLMVFFWPIGFYALFKYWGEKEDSPRTPLLLALAVFAAWASFIGWGFLHTPTQVASDDTEMMSPAEDGGGDTIADHVKRSVAIANLRRQTGSVDIPGAPVSIDVPAHFRFIDRASLLNAFSGTDDEPDDGTIGWLVHERVDLSSDQAWHVQVNYRGDGYIASNDFATAGGDALLAHAQDAARKVATDAADGVQLLRFAEAPTFDPATARVNWVEEVSQNGHRSPALDCYAIQLGRKGAVFFSIVDAAVKRQELCLRSVRMLAAHAHFGPGQTYADHSGALDRKAPYTLTDLVTGEYFADHPE